MNMPCPSPAPRLRALVLSGTLHAVFAVREAARPFSGREKEYAMNRRHRLFVLALVLIVLIPALRAGPALAQANSGGEGWFSSATREGLRERSASLAERVERGEYDAVAVEFSPAFAAAFDAAALNAAWEMTAAAAGAYEGTIGARAYAQGVHGVVDVFLAHAFRPLVLRFVYGEGGALDGLWISFASAKELKEHFGVTAPSAQTGPNSLDHPVQVGEYGLRGTLVTPLEGAERQKIAVLLVQGSGPSDMDETIPGPGIKPFRDIADGLAQQGISSLRFDKRSYAEPGSFAAGDVTVWAETLDDAGAALELLRSHEETKDCSLWIIGHSFGGMLAPQILEENPFVRGAVVLAGSPRSLWDIVYDQNIAALEAAALPQEQRGPVIDQLGAMRDLANGMTAETSGEVFGFPGEYVVSLNELELAEKFARLSLPLLILQGSRDIQVTPEKDFEAFEALFHGYENVTFGIYEGLGHLFVNEEAKAGESGAARTVEPQVIMDIADWLRRQE